MATDAEHSDKQQSEIVLPVREVEIVEEEWCGIVDATGRQLDIEEIVTALNAAPQVPHGVCRADDPNREAPGIGDSGHASSVGDAAPTDRSARGVAPSVSDDSAGTRIPAAAAPAFSGDMNGASPLEGVPTPRMDKALRDHRWPELVVSEGLKLERELTIARAASNTWKDESMRAKAALSATAFKPGDRLYYRNALDRAAYALFQVKRMVGVPQPVIDFVRESHAEACKALDEDSVLPEAAAMICVRCKLPMTGDRVCEASNYSLPCTPHSPQKEPLK